MRPTNNRNPRTHQVFTPQQCPVVHRSEPSTSDRTGDALEPRYHVTHFKLHGEFKNELVTGLLRDETEKQKQGQTPIVHNIVASSNLHTEEELRQPLHQVPSARSGHLMLSCPARRSLILHGGLGLGQIDLLNDTWEYCIDEQRWIQLICRGSNTRLRRPTATNPDVARGEQMPPKAFGQCGTLFGGGRFLFVHGGVMTAEHSANALPAFQLDIERRVWSQIPLSDPLPTMWGSVAQTLTIPVFDDDKLPFPGDDHALLKRAGSGTAWTTRNGSRTAVEFATKMKKTTTVSESCEGTYRETADAAESPASRGKGAAREPKRFVEVVVVFGGMHDVTAYNSTYYLYLTTPPPGGRPLYQNGERRVVLKLQSPLQSIFPGRRRACSAACEGIFLFIFGGRDSINFYNDLWVLNGYTRQWVMVREETPLRYMREFFTRPYDWEPGRRVMVFIEDVLRATLMERAINLSQYSTERNSSARRRTGAVMVSRGSDIFIHGGFTYDSFGLIDTHQDVHVYNYMRHVWRPVTLETDCKMPQFPTGYFKPALNNDNNNNNHNHNEEEEEGEEGGERNTGAVQWEKVRELISTHPDGRTMAAMCTDPVLPGHRFFLFGGRSEDEARGELYDVRVTVFHPTVGALPVPYAPHFYRFMMAEGEEEEEGVLAAAAQALPQDNCNERNSAVGSYFRAEKATQQKYAVWRKRRLCDQAADWVRAIMQEESTLQRTMDAIRDRNKESGLLHECLDEAHRAGTAMKLKVDLSAPALLQTMLTWTPAFIHRG